MIKKKTHTQPLLPIRNEKEFSCNNHQLCFSIFYSAPFFWMLFPLLSRHYSQVGRLLFFFFYFLINLRLILMGWSRAWQGLIVWSEPSGLGEVHFIKPGRAFVPPANCAVVVSHPSEQTTANTFHLNGKLRPRDKSSIPLIISRCSWLKQTSLGR